jgi:hypothetical protein
MEEARETWRKVREEKCGKARDQRFRETGGVILSTLASAFPLRATEIRIVLIQGPPAN